MKTILVATDFSPAALNATEYAADMAMAIHSDLLLLHVCSLPVIYGEMPATVNAEDMIKDAEKEIYQLKNEMLRKTANKLNLETEVCMGVFFEELKSVCQRVKPYTVIMGSQGTSAAERLMLGGHTVYAMKHLAWPLITVPTKAKFSSIKKIGLACDFDKVVDTIPVDEIKMLVNDNHAELHILNIGRKEVFSPELVFESGLVQEMLLDLKPNYHFITGEHTDEGIMDFAEKNNIDLLIVLPKRRSLSEKLIHKSHTKQLVMHSHVPVMALH
jgi:nucleotide-binding universal stress UspA family protein